jgi:xanthine dehydrogenase accessory factor
VFLEPMLPQPHVIVVGRSPAVHTLTSLASDLDWRVTVVDDGGSRDDHPLAGEVIDHIAMPAGVDHASAIVIATQGHYDEPALEAALATDAGYIGLVASPKRAATVLGYLRDRGMDQALLGRVVAPAGIDLGHTTHKEIAVAVIAQLVQMRAEGAFEGWPQARVTPHYAVDPVCHMDVEVATARWISEHEGQTFYFCAPGCKAAFERAPAEYVTV